MIGTLKTWKLLLAKADIKPTSNLPSSAHFADSNCGSWSVLDMKTKGFSGSHTSGQTLGPPPSPPQAPGPTHLKRSPGGAEDKPDPTAESGQGPSSGSPKEWSRPKPCGCSASITGKWTRTGFPDANGSSSLHNQNPQLHARGLPLTGSWQCFNTVG